MIDYIFLTTSLLNTLCHHAGLHKKKTEYIWNIYFYILVTYWWKTEIVPLNSIIYFILDIYNCILNNTLSRFYIFHHSLAILISMINIFIKPWHERLVDLVCCYEISSIPLMLFYSGYISKPVYNLVFSYSFLFIRLFYFNHQLYKEYLINTDIMNNYTIIFMTILNIMNCGIAWKMKLVQKLFAIRPVIDLFSNKRAIK